MRIVTTALAGAAAVALWASASAAAEDILRGPANDLVMFERWCTDIAKYDSERCAGENPADYAEFVVYRNTVERYEAGFLQEREASRTLYRRVQTQDVIEPNLETAD